MYLKEMLGNAVLTEDIEDGDLVLVNSDTASWCDIPMILRRHEWERIFVTYRASEPDIEVVGSLLVSGKSKKFLARFASESDVVQAYQQLRGQLDRETGGEAEAMNYPVNTAGIDLGIGDGIAQSGSDGIGRDLSAAEIPEPNRDEDEARTVVLSPAKDVSGESAILAGEDILFNGAFTDPVVAHAGVSFDGPGDARVETSGDGSGGCAIENSAQSSMSPESGMEPIDKSDATDGAEVEVPISDGTSSDGNIEQDYSVGVPLSVIAGGGSDDVVCATTGDAGQAGDSGEIHAESSGSEDRTHDDATTPSSSNESEGATTDACTTSSGNSENQSEEATGMVETNEPPTRLAEFEEISHNVRVTECIPCDEIVWDHGLTSAFRQMISDFGEVFRAVDVSTVILSSYATCDIFVSEWRSRVGNAPALNGYHDLSDSRQFMSLLLESYIACLYHVARDDFESAQRLYKLFAAMIYEEDE